MSYLEDVNERRRSHSDRQQNAVMMKALQSQKPSIILTDSTDLGEHISQLGDKVIGVMKMVQADHSAQEQIDRLAGEFKTLADLARKTAREQSEQIATALNDLKAVIQNQKPIFAPAPSVNLQEREVDFTPLLQKMDALMKPKKELDLSKYRAHDLEDGRDNMQYIGFQDMTGGWYIMQHDPTANRDRYYFGKGSYDEAWDEKYSLEYKVLSEAIHALSA